MSLFKSNPINDETLADVVPNGTPKPEDKATPPVGALTCDNATHFKAPNGRVFPATDILRRMSKSDGKLKPCGAPQAESE